MSREYKGVFIAFEGIDGAGSTTHSILLSKWLKEQGYEVLLTKEPSENEIGKLIRNLLYKKIPPAVDALLFAADRILHLHEEIKPTLERGDIVISDRYIESSLAYQVAQGLDPKWVLEINKYAIQPDMNIILDIDPEAALKRKGGKASTKFESVNFLKKVREIFLERAKIKNYIVIDTTGPINKVQEEIRRTVLTLLQRKLI